MCNRDTLANDAEADNVHSKDGSSGCSGHSGRADRATHVNGRIRVQAGDSHRDPPPRSSECGWQRSSSSAWTTLRGPEQSNTVTPGRSSHTSPGGRSFLNSGQRLQSPLTKARRGTSHQAPYTARREMRPRRCQQSSLSSSSLIDTRC